LKPEKTTYDFHQLEVFCAVLEKGSFSVAAMHLGITQPTVSAHIAAMEKGVGAILIDRKGRKVEPTKAGSQLYGYAKKMLALKEEADISLSGVIDVVRGDLVIAGSNIPGTYFLPVRASEFMRNNVDVRVKVLIGDSRDATNIVGSGEAELGVVGMKPKEKHFDSEPLWEDELVLAVSSGHDWAVAGRNYVTLKMLSEEPFLMREKGSATRELMESNLSEKGIKPGTMKAVCELGGTEAVKQGIISGAGVSILSRNSIINEMAAGLITEIPVRGVRFARNFFLISDSRKTLSPAAAAFAGFLKES